MVQQAVLLQQAVQVRLQVWCCLHVRLGLLLQEELEACLMQGCQC